MSVRCYPMLNLKEGGRRGRQTHLRLTRGQARYGLDGLRGEREGPCQASISVEGRVSSCTPRDDA